MFWCLAKSGRGICTAVPYPKIRQGHIPHAHWWICLCQDKSFQTADRTGGDKQTHDQENIRKNLHLQQTDWT